MNDFVRDYRILGLTPGCSLQTLKAARRRLVVTWHPDRFPSGSGEKVRAEDRIKDINTAFDRLLEYHRRFGVLPLPAASAPTPPPVSADTAAPQPRDADVPVTDRGRKSASNLPYTRMRAPLRWAIAVVLIILFVQAMHTNINRTDEPAPIDASQPDDSPGDEPPDDATSAPTPPVPRRVFRIGSTIDDVYAAQGTPSATQNGIWYYGKSKIYFTNGVVTGWDSDPSNPLNVASRSDRTTTPTPRTFTVGSTKAEVRAVQGAPFGETDTRWDYGPSTVYFRDGRVVRWKSSPSQPLKTRK